jgi:bifunctional non-homologous end joining protein LigD
VLRSADVEPMLASLSAPFSRPGWLFELKYDGFRMLAAKEANQPRLRFRSGTDVTLRFPEVAAAVGALPGADLVLDGELVVMTEDGRPDFQRLQKRFLLRNAVDIGVAARASPASLFAFDLLASDGLDLRGVPLRERKAALAEVLDGTGVGLVEHVEEEGEALYREVARRGLEGLVAKRALSTYAGGRSRHWRKFPVQRTSEFVIVGFTVPGLGRQGGLHLASARGRRLVYAGRVGTGFEAGALGAARELLGRRPVEVPPCAGAPRSGAHTWVEPRVVCEVRFLERTDEGLLRHPVFVRFRPDKARRVQRRR